MGMNVANNVKIAIIVFVGALILSAVLLGLRQTALKSAYDSSASFTVNDSAGVTHTIAGSGISGDTVATLYALGLGFVWLVAIIAILMLLVKGI